MSSIVFESEKIDNIFFSANEFTNANTFFFINLRPQYMENKN